MVGRKVLKIVDTSQPVLGHYIRAEVSEMNHTALVLLFLVIASEVEGLKGFEGLGRLGPSGLAALGYALAFYFLAQSLDYIPLGVA
jgi:hypothetical protein